LTQSENDKPAANVNRRDALKLGGMAAAGMTAMLAAFGADPAGASGTSAAMEVSDFTNFTKLVTDCWNSASLTKQYNADPQSVLAKYDVNIPDGIPIPVLPKKPKGSFGTETAAGKAWDKTYVNALPNWTAAITSSSGTTTALAAKGTFSCFACPVSTFCCITA
jgi:hypothetical protein